MANQPTRRAVETVQANVVKSEKGESSVLLRNEPVAAAGGYLFHGPVRVSIAGVATASALAACRHHKSQHQ